MAANMSYSEQRDRLRKAKAELKNAGPIHRKDLQRYIRRMEKELRIYDNYHRG